MPDGDILDVEIPIGGESEKEMAVDLSDNVANHMLTQLMQTGAIAQNNFVTLQKVNDYDFLENKRMVTLDEAIGVREVASKNVPAGPTST